MRIKLGFIIGIFILFTAKYNISNILLFTAVILIFLGEFIRFWAAGHLKKNQMLTTSGPYKFTRNPLYLGSSLILTGFLIIYNKWFIGIFIIIMFLLIYYRTLLREENFLKERFSREYENYCKIVPQIFPKFSNVKIKSNTKFSLGLAVKNKEYNAIIGILAIFVIMRLSLGLKLLYLLKIL